MIVAFHFLCDDMTARSGSEPAWTVGETRTIQDPKRIKICSYGYHWSPSWLTALGYASGPMACRVEVSAPANQDSSKGVSARRTLLAAHDVSHELRLFAADCADRALNLVESIGHTVDPRSRSAIMVSRQFALGKATADELSAAESAARSEAREAARSAEWSAEWSEARREAESAARSAEWSAARATAWSAARSAAWLAAWAAEWSAESAARATEWSTEWSAAWLAEKTWQSDRLDYYLDPVVI